jgi:hypothetical protein
MADMAETVDMVATVAEMAVLLSMTTFSMVRHHLRHLFPPQTVQGLCIQKWHSKNPIPCLLIWPSTETNLVRTIFIYEPSPVFNTTGVETTAHLSSLKIGKSGSVYTV